jgi:branched-chain amino acid transport system permease protein
LFAQLIVMGLATGCLYSLIALAMVIIYKTSEILNFAQGELAMLTTFFAFVLLVNFGLPFWAALPATLVFSMLLGAMCELVFLQPARERSRVMPLVLLWTFTVFVLYLAIFKDPGVPASLAVVVAIFAGWMTAETFSKRPLRKPTLLGLIIITLGLEMILYGAAGGLWGAGQQALPSPVSDMDVHEVGGVIISNLNLVIFAVSIILVAGLFTFFKYTRIGVAMKATAQNPLASRLMGIRPTRIYMFTWALAALVGAFAGLLTASSQPLDPNLMMESLLKGFAAAVLGGMNSLAGAVLGGCILGILENLVAGYLPDGTQYKSTVAFIVIVLMLCVRPSGLLGHHYVKKV